MLLVSADPIWLTEVRIALERAGAKVESVEDADDAFALIYAVATRIAVLHDEGLPESIEELFGLFGAVTRSSPVEIMFATDERDEEHRCVDPMPHETAAGVLQRVRASRAPKDGTFDDGQFDDLMRSLIERASSGVLVVRHSDLVAKVVVAHGRIVLYTSSGTEDRVGQICLARGLIREADLRAALAEQRASFQPLGKILGAVSSASDVEAALAEHYVAAVAELFLWERGQWSFFPYTPHAEPEAGSPLGDAMQRGIAARPQWRALSGLSWLEPTTLLRMVPAPDAQARGLPDGQARVAELLLTPRSIEGLRLELRALRSSLYTTLATMVDEGLVEVVTAASARRSSRRPTAPPMGPNPQGPRDSDSPPDTLRIVIDTTLADATRLMESGSRLEARERLLDVLAIDPSNAPALTALRGIERQDAESARAVGLCAETEVTLTVSLTDLTGAITPESAFVFSRLAEQPYTVDDLLAMCPLSEADVLAILEQGVSDGYVKVVG